MISDTAVRLQNLKPGESFVYYRGNFDADIHRSKPNGTEREFWVHERKFGPGAPRYARLLSDILLTAESLESTGRAELTQRTVVLTGMTMTRRGREIEIPDTTITEYIATGRFPKKKPVTEK